jgi:hypothetical protein
VQTNYTPATWATFADALEAAQITYDNPAATQDQLDAARQALVSAMLGLVRVTEPPTPCPECEEHPCECPPAVNRAALAAVIELADAREQANYTPATWATFAAALQAAQAMYDNADATQAQIDSARQALIAAMNGLVRVTDPPPDRIPGEPGDRGPAGPTGPAGPAGPAGAPGADARPVPKTGDTANMSLWLMMFALGFLGLAASTTKLKLAGKRNSKSMMMLIKGDNGEDKYILK